MIENAYKKPVSPKREVIMYERVVLKGTTTPDIFQVLRSGAEGGTFSECSSCSSSVHAARIHDVPMMRGDMICKGLPHDDREQLADLYGVEVRWMDSDNEHRTCRVVVSRS